MTPDEARQVLQTSGLSPADEALYTQLAAFLEVYPDRAAVHLSVVALHLLTDIMCAQVARETPGSWPGVVAVLEDYLKVLAVVYEAKCVLNHYPVDLPPWTAAESGL
jgi:hypothetical protein